MSINLTNRKKSQAPKPLGTFLKEQTDNGTIYKVRYSEAYQPEGHDFITSFKVLRLAYWLKYHILTQDDIATYETLQLLCEREIPFTLERLAEETGIGKETLRQRLDNLENAELLTIGKGDGQGQPNVYILRTPLFERDSLDGESPQQLRRKKQIWSAGRELPETYIEDHQQRLVRNIRKNRAKKERQILRQTKYQKRNQKLYQRIKANFEEKKLVWFKIVKLLGNSKAAALDGFIWKLAKSDFSNVETTAFNKILRDRIKEYLRRLEIAADAFFVDYVERLFYFYSPQVRVEPRPSAGPRGENAGVSSRAAANGENNDFNSSRSDTEKAMLRKVLEAKVPKNNSVWSKANIKDVVRVCKEYGQNLDVSTIEAIAAEILPGFIFEKLTVELRT